LSSPGPRQVEVMGVICTAVVLGLKQLQGTKVATSGGIFRDAVRSRASDAGWLALGAFN